MLVMAAVAAGGFVACGGTAGAGFALTGRLGHLGMIRLVASGCSSAAAVTALVLAGPMAYLMTTALAGLCTTTVVVTVARRIVTRSAAYLHLVVFLAVALSEMPLYASSSLTLIFFVLVAPRNDAQEESMAAPAVELKHRQRQIRTPRVRAESPFRESSRP